MSAPEGRALAAPLVTADWGPVAAGPRADVLARRLDKARRRLASFQRKVALLESRIRSRAGAGARVLEVACGTGFTTLELANRGLSAVGVDASPELCALTNAAAAHFGVDARAVAGDGCALPFAEGRFDAVFSESFFEHVYDVDLTLREQARVLRPGGLLLLLDGNLLNPLTLLDLLVFYPLRTRGRHGGLRWLLTKRRVHRNLYGYLARGRDEDVKTMWWWRRRLRRHPELRVLEIGTSAPEAHPGVPRLLHPFVGACKVVAEKA